MFLGSFRLFVKFIRDSLQFLPDFLRMNDKLLDEEIHRMKSPEYREGPKATEDLERNDGSIFACRRLFLQPD